MLCIGQNFNKIKQRTTLHMEWFYFFTQKGMGMEQKKGNCRSPSEREQPRRENEKLTERDLRALMGHEAFERGSSGAIRSRRRGVVLR